jgi:hypothetical protein
MLIIRPKYAQPDVITSRSNFCFEFGFKIRRLTQTQKHLNMDNVFWKFFLVNIIV